MAANRPRSPTTGEAAGRAAGAHLAGQYLPRKPRRSEIVTTAPVREQREIPLFNVPLLPRPRLTELIDRATRHKVVLVCGPAGAGKTVACALWAAASSSGKRVAWLTLRADEDGAWFWADLAGQLRRARLMPREAMAYLEEASADGFPFRLVEMARRLTTPLVVVLDNAHALDDRAVVAGLDVLISHAPPNLCVLLAGRHAPGIRLDRLRASGELATVGAADLACTSDEADSYLAMAGAEFLRAGRDELSGPGKFFIGELRHAAMGGEAMGGEAMGGEAPADASVGSVGEVGTRYRSTTHEG